jgi:hypothetical protein
VKLSYYSSLFSFSRNKCEWQYSDILKASPSKFVCSALFRAFVRVRQTRWLWEILSSYDANVKGYWGRPCQLQRHVDCRFILYGLRHPSPVTYSYSNVALSKARGLGDHWDNPVPEVPVFLMLQVLQGFLFVWYQQSQNCHSISNIWASYSYSVSGKQVTPCRVRRRVQTSNLTVYYKAWDKKCTYLYRKGSQFLGY